MGILDQFRLDGQVAIVTGSGRGIGAACAKAFAEAGADVVLSARSMDELEQTAEVVRSFGREALVVQTDVMQEDQLQNLLDKTLEKFGKVNILVNNAGGHPPKPMLKTSTEEFNNAFKFNVSTAYAMSRITIPAMVETAGGGSIINISSVAGTEPSSFFTTYGTVKSALSFLTREMAQEFAPKVRVNAIGVGSTKTEALKTVLNDDIEKMMVDLTPMARLGEVEDIAACALYLASPASSYLTGDIIGVNGGLNALNMQMPRAFD